jgi:hypothetical protein
MKKNVITVKYALNPAQLMPWKKRWYDVGN